MRSGWKRNSISPTSFLAFPASRSRASVGPTEFSGARSALWVAREERSNDRRDLIGELLMQRKLAPGNTDTLHTVNRRECFHFGARSWRRLSPIDRQHRDRRLSRQSKKLFACFDRIECPGHKPD